MSLLLAVTQLAEQDQDMHSTPLDMHDVLQAYLLVSKSDSVATALLDITPFQHRVQHWIKFLLYVLNQQWLAK